MSDDLTEILRSSIAIMQRHQDMILSLEKRVNDLEGLLDLRNTFHCQNCGNTWTTTRKYFTDGASLTCQHCHKKVVAGRGPIAKIVHNEVEPSTENPEERQLTCKFCGFVNKFPRTKGPVKCPRCSNQYARTPTRKLRGRVTLSGSGQKDKSEGCPHCGYIRNYGWGNIKICPNCHKNIRVLMERPPAYPRVKVPE